MADIVRLVCDGGLELSKSKDNAPPGTLRDCLNYEVANGEGYRRALGLLGYSGDNINGVVDPYLAFALLGGGVEQLSNASLTDFTSLSEGETVTWGDGGTFVLEDGTLATYDGRAKVCFVRAVASTRGVVALAQMEGRFPVVGDVITSAPTTITLTAPLWLASEVTSADGSSSTLIYGSTYTNTMDGLTALISDFDMRPSGDIAHFLPSAMNGYVAGGFFWRDRAYVVCDLDTWSFTAGATEPAEGDLLRVYYSGNFGSASTAYQIRRVEKVITTSGSWAAGTAAGTIWLAWEGPYSETFNERAGTHPIAPTSVYNQTTATNTPFTFGVRVPPQGAALYKDTTAFGSAGWERVGLGYEVRFKTGGNFMKVLNRGARDTELEVATTTTSYTFPGTATANGWTNASNITATDAAYASFNTIGTAPTPPLVASNFGLAIPTTAAILGVEVQIVRRHEDGAIGNDAKDYLVDLVGISGTSDNKAKQGIWTEAAGFETVTYGSASDCWNTNLSPSVVNGAGFGVRLRVNGTSGSTGGGDQYRVDSISLRITYKPFTSTVYFRDTVAGSDVSTGRAIWYYRDKGTYAGTDAEGVLTVYDLSSPSAIREGMQIRDTAGGAGTLYALTGSGANKVYMDASPALAANNSQYTFTIGNFFARKDTEQVFGASGAGFGFSLDKDYFIRIRTSIEQNQDKPRHVAIGLAQLYFGYGSGLVITSDEGYPESFAGTTAGKSPINDDTTTYPNGAAGALLIGVGQPVRGLGPLSEQSMGVYCERSIQQIVGTGAGAVRNTIAPKWGVIEYTLQDVGIPVFLTSRGWATIDATAAYGDFLPRKLSKKVAKWLVPRLQETGAAIGTNRGVIRTEVFRSKNQVRTYFRDGKVLIMTFVGDGFDNPQFTFGSLPFTPTFTFSGVTSSGRDMVFIGTYGHASIGATANSLTTAYEASASIMPDVESGNLYPPNFIYQMDVGSTWDNIVAYDAFIELHGGALGKEWEEKRFERMIVSGDVYGTALVGVSYSINFGDFPTSGATQNLVFGRPPTQTSGTPAENIKAWDEQPFSLSVPELNTDNQQGTTGYAIGVKIESNGDELYGQAVTANTSPYKFRPHTIQSVTFFTEPEKLRRG